MRLSAAGCESFPAACFVRFYGMIRAVRRHFRHPGRPNVRGLRNFVRS